MAIAFRSSAATAYGSRTNITVAAPAGIVDGDILVAMVATGAATPPIPSTPTGWTAFGTDIQDGTSGAFVVNLRTFWKRASSESGSYTFNHASASSAGWIGCYSGCITSGTPLAATSTNFSNTGVGTTSTGLGITTTAANSFLLWLGNDFADTANNLTPPTGMTERLDAVVIYTADQLIASAGATGNRTMTNNNSSSDANGAWGVRLVELLAATGVTTSTGTLGVTLGTATAAATGKVLVQGTLGATLGALTLAGSGTVSSLVATGTLSATLGALTAAATGKVLVRGTAGITLAPLTLFGAGTNRPIVTGTFAVVLGALNLDGSGTVANRANPWKLELRDFTAWSVETTGSQTRLIEAGGYRRITEQGNIRIIERFPFSWSTEPSSHNPWTQE